MPRRPLALVGLALALAAVGCGDGGEETSRAPSTATERRAAQDDARPTGTGAAPATTAATPSADGGSDASPGVASTSAPPRGWTATCPTTTPSALGCAAVRGRVLAIQSLDPDGDGDLHVVAVGGDVTGPGITVFDVRPSLRPERDPRKGEYVTGAGPVFEGSLGQRQIQVDRFRVWRP
ncbi:hypothetical protein [Patulibacter sp.]|uniref:hypothetical protein n=1 Tax=Patulibacter sp. TaxID=1912859 RepID=UPI00271D5BD5|nr:hypothetical protein [Patulibacter sp.]MDO9407328.1 hypothetical protein [Patulibacter sp.]